MAISIPQGYIVTSNEPIDNRLIMTKEQMKFMSRAQGMLPTVYFCLCSERDDKGLYKIYIYDTRSDWDDETGYYHIYKADTLGTTYAELPDKPKIGGKEIVDDKTADYYGLQTLLTNGAGIDDLNAGIVKVLFDNDTLKINSDGELYADVDLTELRKMINDEIARAKNSEGVLFNLIAAEQTRATTAETTLANDLNAEVNRALGSEGALRADILREVQRARSSEGVLRADLLNEIQRAKTSEGILRTTKQNRLTDGDGIRLTGDTISVDLFKGNVLPNRTGANGKALTLNNSGQLAWSDAGKIDMITVTDGATSKVLRPDNTKNVTIRFANQKVLTTDTATPLIDVFPNSEIGLNTTFLNRLELKEFKKNVLDSEGINDPKFYPTVQLLNTEVGKRQKDLNAGNAIKLTSEGVDKEKIDVLYDNDTIKLDTNNKLFAHDVDLSFNATQQRRLRNIISIQTSEGNILRDEDWILDQLASNLGAFRGNFDSEGALPTKAQVPALAKNDYAFVTDSVTTSEGVQYFYNRFKFIDTPAQGHWEFEYRVSGSTFTTNQLKALNSNWTAQLTNAAIDHMDGVVPQTVITNKQAYKLTMDDQGHITSTELYNPEWPLSVDNRTVASPTDSRIVKTAPYVLQGTDTNRNAVRIARAGVASGNSSVAMGSGSQSTGSYSISGGLNAVAQGSVSIAFGNEPTASGNYSVAMGYHPSATGDQSVALGNSVTASGTYSFAEGNTTTASGQSAHVEGFMTIASGDNSHAEGNVTFATGIASHAEGTTLADGLYDQTAAGDGSHVEGSSNWAVGNYSHVEGSNNKTLGAMAHAEGDHTEARAQGSHTEGYMTLTSEGMYAHAEGLETKAFGEGSHAEGTHTEANGIFSHAENGSRAWTEYGIVFIPSIANGASSHAEGTGHAEGKLSHAEGSETLVEGEAAHAEGRLTEATGNYSHAEGRETLAEGEASHTEGSGTYTTGISSHAEGADSRAYGKGSHAEGIQNVAGDEFDPDIQAAHAEGLNTVASGLASHAEGGDTEASGESSHAEGMGARAVGNYSHAEGVARAIGSLSHAEGGRVEEIGVANGPIAFGPSSHAEGVGTRTNGEASHAEGRGTIASSNNQHVQGQYNVEDTGNLYADIVGWGTNTSARKNISSLTTTGDLHIKKDFYFQSDDDGQNGYKLPYTVEKITGNGAKTLALAKRDHIYIYTGTLTSLTVTAIENVDAITDIIFTAGTSITVNLPSTIKKPKDFTFEPNKTYEINILNNLALIGVWE